jgi:conjugative relaxase-like TrwC/TraI family protein
MVGVTKIGARTANYWINAVAEGGDDYYTKPGEAPGHWLGELSGRLGLDGEVDAAAYAAVLAGKDPSTGSVLVHRPQARVFVDSSGRERRLDPILGYDIRFSAPKSVSLLWAIGSSDIQEAVLRAHDEAVRSALRYLEAEACFVQRGKGGKEIQRGEGFISMGFLHRSSRAGDPALHTHVVTANMTRAASDGRWLSLANPKSQSPLLREAKAAGYLYQASLRANLSRSLGVNWATVVNGYSDVTMIPRAAIEHFSRRRAQIVTELQSRGVDTAAAAEIAAYRTRGPKGRGQTSDRQRSDWRSEAGEFYLSEESIGRALARTPRREPRAPTTDDLDAAVAVLEDTHSHFDRRDLLYALANRLPDGADTPMLLDSVDAVLASDRVLVVHRGQGLMANSYYTTPRLWELEQKVLAAATQGEGAGAAVVPDATLQGVLSRHEYLSDEQAAMVRRLTAGGERIVTVAALPGAGKTTALKAAAEAWAEAGIPGLGVASARSASGELGDGAEIPATSIADLLIRCESLEQRGQNPLPRGTVILLDESSTASTPQIAALVDLVNGCDGKLVAIGDPRQIGAVGPGGVYGHLTDLIQPSVLTQIRRQNDPNDRHIVELAHEGRGSDALDLLRADNRLKIADDLDGALDALALDWHQRFIAGEDAVMIARRGRDVADLNLRARQLLLDEARLQGRPALVAGEEFVVGDRVVTRVNNSRVSNRERWDVIGVDPKGPYLRLEKVDGDGRQVIAGPNYLERRTESGGPPIEHAYALTTYATESKTFDSAFAFLDSGVSREDFLVAVSRARNETFGYGVAASELLDADLGPARRDVSDDAHDLRLGSERIASEYSATEVSDRLGLEQLTESELVERKIRLVQKLGAETVPSASSERIAAVDKRLATEAERLTNLRDRRAEAPPVSDMRLIESTEKMAQVAIERLESERAELDSMRRAESRQPRGPNGEDRAELSRVEDRLLVLRRRAVAAERVRPSEMIHEALGPRPTDAAKAVLWNEGVDLIYAYRQTHGVSPLDPMPVGARRGDATARREHRDAALRLHRVQRGLAVETSPTVDRSAAIEI